MLIKFSVENYRSIREEQTLSLVKDAPDEMPENYFNSNAPTVPNLLNTAVIYGANASGKSNLLKSLLCMCTIIQDSFNKKLDEDIKVESFILDNDWRDKPTTFNISIVVNFETDKDKAKKLARVDYGFSATRKIILEEWLSVYPNSREQAWFHRYYDEEKADYTWFKDSSLFKGEKESWKKNTRKDQLFLSSAVHLNSEQLKPIYEWFTNVKIVGGNKTVDSDYTIQFCENKIIRKMIVSLLQQADIDVDEILIKKEKRTFNNLPDDLPVFLKNKILVDYSEYRKVFFIHTDAQGNKVPIELEQESDGTKKLFEYAAPIFDVLVHGRLFIVDELNNSLHADLVRYLVKIFSSGINEDGAQLIITTHETSILRKDLLRRDQIWFCEKTKNKSTILYPLTDFSPRKDREDIEESYISGRYGGKPTIQAFIPPDDENDAEEE